MAFFKLFDFRLLTLFHVKAKTRTFNGVRVAQVEVSIHSKPSTVPFVFLIIELAVVKAEVGRSAVTYLSKLLGDHLILLLIWQRGVTEY